MPFNTASPLAALDDTADGATLYARGAAARFTGAWIAAVPAVGPLGLNCGRLAAAGLIFIPGLGRPPKAGADGCAGCTCWGMLNCRCCGAGAAFGVGDAAGAGCGAGAGAWAWHLLAGVLGGQFDAKAEIGNASALANNNLVSDVFNFGSQCAG